jgi:hypothetical protein
MSLPSEFVLYVSRIRQFDRTDWGVYLFWVGTMLGLFGSTGGFLLIGHQHGVVFPASAWLVPVGAGIFAMAIAIDTIGHRTVYKEALRAGEQLVHHITIFCGVGSCVLLCVAYDTEGAWIPAAVLTVLSFMYSLIDEAFHWRRYSSGNSDRVEMWSHLFIFIGHGTMMGGWWAWYAGGYVGVDATVRALGGAP